MKNMNILGAVAGFMLVATTGGCGTPKVGPARTTLAPMPGVEPLASLKETRTPTGTNTVKEFMSPTMAQYKLRMKELEGNEAVAKGNRSSVTSWTPGYRYYSGGFIAPHHIPAPHYGPAGHNYSFSTR